MMEYYCIISNFICILIFILTCNMTVNSGMKNDIILPLVKVVDCTEPDAIYQYDYKVVVFCQIEIVLKDSIAFVYVTKSEKSSHFTLMT